MFGLVQSITKADNDFAGGGVGKSTDDETIKKVARKIIVRSEEKVVTNRKTKEFLRILKPVILLIIMGVVVDAAIKNIIGVDKFIGICENFVKLMLS